jgi:hypothetical protein
VSYTVEIKPDVTYVTECGATVAQGDRVYNYYSMEPGIIGRSFDGTWFEFHGETSRKRTQLNGQRICTIEFAKRRGFRGV